MITSFAILHEITAIVPFVGLFYVARSLDAGNRAVQLIRNDSAEDPGMVVRKARDWLNEGEDWAARVGTRYGLWGYEKGSKRTELSTHSPGGNAGDVANAMLAYGLTKVCIFGTRSRLMRVDECDKTTRLFSPPGLDYRYGCRQHSRVGLWNQRVWLLLGWAALCGREDHNGNKSSFMKVDLQA